MSPSSQPRRIRLGIITPSSNTALEPLTYSLLTALNAHLPSTQFTAHFSRVPVTQISLSADGLAQFDLEPMLAAAQLLAHAEVDIIGWSGTSAGWLGFSNDTELCRKIEETTRIKATTSTLALLKAIKIWKVEKLGLVTPYLDDVQAKIVENFEGFGVEIGEGMERHLRVEKNNQIVDIGEDTLDEMVGDVITKQVNAVTTFCTNLVAAQRAEFWETKYRVPVFDTVTTVIWDMVRECSIDATGLKGWGMIFDRNFE